MNFEKYYPPKNFKLLTKSSYNFDFTTDLDDRLMLSPEQKLELSLQNLPKQAELWLYLQEGSSLKFNFKRYFEGYQADLKIFIVHLQPKSQSQVKMVNYLDQKSQINIQAQVIILPAAQDSQADLQLYSFLLDSQSQSKLKPELKIYNKEVTARHGAVVSGIPEETLEYTKSRGLDEIEIKQLFRG